MTYHRPPANSPENSVSLMPAFKGRRWWVGHPGPDPLSCRPDANPGRDRPLRRLHLKLEFPYVRRAASRRENGSSPWFSRCPDPPVRRGRPQAVHRPSSARPGAETRLCEIGCGCLRTAYWLIRFLDSGKYCGIEPHRDRVTWGLETLFDRDMLDSKAVKRFPNGLAD